jgi:hypothetical protein
MRIELRECFPLRTDTVICGAAEPQDQPGCFGAAGLMAKVFAENQRFQP